jgi:formylglycine-generating enzyme required for sulfatase activity
MVRMQRARLAPLLLAAASTACAPEQPASDGAAPPRPAPPGMVWIPPGEFDMGGSGPLARADEFPVHRVRLEGFWIDRTEVTNAQYAAFVAATGYTTVAERAVDWEVLRRQLPEGAQRPEEALLAPGSLVFVAPESRPDPEDYSSWWRWTPGACWKHPAGPGSNVEGKDDEPVVHIAFEDALAYCAWAGKSLPTEAQWERAARGGLAGKHNAWGDEPIDERRANTWQGEFPVSNTRADGHAMAAPVASYPPNGWGLHDMAGNVWEWCLDLYAEDAYALALAAAGGGTVVDPRGPSEARDPRNPRAKDSRVQRGGSFLCNDSYCASYRPSARMSCAPDTGSSHVGFRCVLAPP